MTLLKKGTAQQTYRFGNGLLLKRSMTDSKSTEIFTVSPGPPYRSVSVTRDVNAPDNRLFVSHGVVRLLG